MAPHRAAATRPLSVALATLLVLAACAGGSSSPTAVAQGQGSVAAPTATATATATTSVSPSPSPAASPSIGPLPPNFDPCTLLTDDEASQVNGVTYGPGTASVAGSLIQCVWQNAPAGSVTVQVLVAPSFTEAQVAFTEAEAEQKGFTIVHLSPPPSGPPFDEAVITRAPGGIRTGGIFVRVGDTFFDIIYLQGTTPTDAALVASALIVYGAIP